MPVRLDKWLQVARIFKTRSLATHACDLGRVKVNGSPVKSHRHLAVGDRIEVEDAHWPRVVVVVELRDRPLPKAQAATLYADQGPPRPLPDPFARQLRRPPALRPKGSGRPTKKERREIERWEGEDEPDRG
jgi:ribosome-associated heat shock protein Hsp15